ncbi:MAG: NAD(P)/FAD-dependent oxidoreductase [Planctomycetales bacterium]
MTANLLNIGPVWLERLALPEREVLEAGRGRLLHDEPDVLVVGGGIVGLSIAYFLSERGATVQLLETNTLAGGASGANAGGIWPNDQGPLHPPGFQALAQQSRDLWGRLSLSPEFDFDWRVNGLLNVNADRIGPSATEAAARLQELGYTLHAVDAEQIALLEPQLRPGFVSGLHLPSEAQLNPVKAAVSLARAARTAGVGIATGAAALSVHKAGGRITQVETTAGRVSPGQVVSATGWNASWLHEVTPLPPLRPVSGQLISTDPLPPLLSGVVIDRYLMFQLRTGEVVTGGNLVEEDRLIPDAALSEQFAQAACETLPALRAVPFTRAWCGVRPGSPDGLPIVDRAQGLDNLWWACGHFRNGVLLAPVTGKLLAEWILTGARPESLEPCRLARLL